jgi:hypothetical protein
MDIGSVGRNGTHRFFQIVYVFFWGCNNNTCIEEEDDDVGISLPETSSQTHSSKIVPENELKTIPSRSLCSIRIAAIIHL